MSSRNLFSGILASLVLGTLAANPANGFAADPVVPIPLALPPARDAAKDSGPRIYFPEIEHNFGTVQPGEKVTHSFKVKNQGDSNLEITEVRPSCGCTTAGSWSRLIKPGESGDIPVQLDTSRFKGELTKTISVTSNDPTHKLAVLKLVGSIWVPIALSETHAVFSSNLDLEVPQTKVITIENKSGTPLELSDLNMTSKLFTAKVNTVTAGEKYELEITTVPPLQPGTNRGIVSLKTNNPNMASISLSVFATVLPAVQVIPPKIILPAAKLTTEIKRYVTLVNRRAGDLVVSDLQAKGVSVTATELQQGKRVTIALTFPVGFEVPDTEQPSLIGKTNRPELPEFEVPFTYSGAQ